MDVGLLSKSYAVRRLNEGDVDALFELMRENTLYYKYHPPFVTKESIVEDMRALPLKKGYEDKYYVGFFDENGLVANMDLILAYPENEVAFIGFFMTDVRFQKKGVGSKIISETCACLKSLGFKKVRLGVDRGNPQSFAFWKKNGFSVLDEGEYIRMEAAL